MLLKEDRWLQPNFHVPQEGWRQYTPRYERRLLHAIVVNFFIGILIINQLLDAKKEGWQ